MAGKIPGTGLSFDPEFCFLLELDPAFEEWRALAVEWLPLERRSRPTRERVSLTAFFRYLHLQNLDKSPRRILDKSAQVPDLIATLSTASLKAEYVESVNDKVSDFIDWVLREKFSEQDADGILVVPNQWRNPFPRKREKNHGARSRLKCNTPIW